MDNKYIINIVVVVSIFKMIVLGTFEELINNILIIYIPYFNLVYNLSIVSIWSITF